MTTSPSPTSPAAADREPLVLLQEAVRAIAAERCDGRDLDSLRTELREMRRQMDLLEGEFVRRVGWMDRLREFFPDEPLSLVGWLRGACRLSGSAAFERVEVARQLNRLPMTEEALARGDIGYEHARVIARTATDMGVEAARVAEPTLLQTAQEVDPSKLRDMAQDVRHLVDPEGALDAARRHQERRRVRLHKNADGAFSLDGLLDPEGGATVTTALNTLMTPVPGDLRTTLQRRADALVEMGRRLLQGGRLPQVAGQRPHVTLTVPVAALRESDRRTLAPGGEGRAGDAGRGPGETPGAEIPAGCRPAPDGSSAPRGAAAGDVEAGAPRRREPAAPPSRAVASAIPGGGHGPAESPPLAGHPPASPRAAADPRQNADGARPSSAAGAGQAAGARGATPAPAVGAGPGGAWDGTGAASPGMGLGTGGATPADASVRSTRTDGALDAARAGSPAMGAAAVATGPPDPGAGPAAESPPDTPAAAEGDDSARATQRIADLRWAGAVPAATARRIACDASVALVTVDADSNPLDVGRSRRTISPAMRRALVLRDRGCRFPGCDRPPEWTTGHHLHHWADGGETRLDNLVLLCQACHTFVHEHGWRLRWRDDGELLAEPP